MYNNYFYPFNFTSAKVQLFFILTNFFSIFLPNKLKNINLLNINYYH
ncbi:hypothetical protein HMPREF9071_1587 [Capnocytophaga sp. oral taxon 338 str. F0234]|nr:hypothetical protein HMPREF9071_1587 [Capnocytophaga sp. oral taxon 338 str. F0234]